MDLVFGSFNLGLWVQLRFEGNNYNFFWRFEGKKQAMEFAKDKTQEKERV